MSKRPGGELKQSTRHHRVITLTYAVLLIGVVLSIGIYLGSTQHLQERSRAPVEFSLARLGWSVGLLIWVLLPLGIFAGVVRSIRRTFRSAAAAVALLLSSTTIVGAGLVLYIDSQSWLGYASFDPKEFFAFMMTPVIQLICVLVLAGVCSLIGWWTQRDDAQG